MYIAICICIQYVPTQVYIVPYTHIYIERHIYTFMFKVGF